MIKRPLNLKRSLLIFSLLGSAAAFAGDKSAYWLFNPTPRDQMREFETDRPDKTESPYTVDAGHFQLEMDLINYISDKTDDGDEIKAAGLGIVNFKLGITNSIDFQAIIGFYQWQDSFLRSTRTLERGIGNVTFRLKWNLYGNDDGDIALGVMPFYTPATSEGGLIGVVAFALPADWDLGTMLVVDRTRDKESDDFDANFTGSFAFSHDIVGTLAGYAELFGQRGAASSSQLIMTFDVGLTYLVLPNLQFDTGINFGLTEAADDLNPFIGLSWRI